MLALLGSAVANATGQSFMNCVAVIVDDVLAFRDDVDAAAAFSSSADFAASVSLRLSSISLRRAFSDCCHAMLEHRMASDLPAGTGEFNKTQHE